MLNDEKNTCGRLADPVVLANEVVERLESTLANAKSMRDRLIVEQAAAAKYAVEFDDDGSIWTVKNGERVAHNGNVRQFGYRVPDEQERALVLTRMGRSGKMLYSVPLIGYVATNEEVLIPVIENWPTAAKPKPDTYELKLEGDDLVGYKNGVEVARRLNSLDVSHMPEVFVLGESTRSTDVLMVGGGWVIRREGFLNTVHIERARLKIDVTQPKFIVAE
jgi:hypothetical protein